MLCQSCKKARATVHLTEIAESGEAQERHLCEECAQGEGVFQKNLQTTAEIVQELLKQGLKIQTLTKVRCSSCGMTIKDFQQSALLGCPICYQEFAEVLKAVVLRAQDGATHHVGKSPRPNSARRQRRSRLMALNRQLQQAVKDEAYELAARLRDEIKSLKP